MKIEAALGEFVGQARRRDQGEGAVGFAAAVDSLREYLLDYAGLEETGAISPEDLTAFLLEYYPSQEEPDSDVAAVLLQVTSAFALWLVERGERRLDPFLAAEERLRENLARVLGALALLKDYTHRDDLGPPVVVTSEDDGAEAGLLDSGLNRVARLDRHDYASADQDYFTVRSVREGSVTLHSAQRQALGEQAIEWVDVPPAAASLLRAGDIIHAEFAPGPEGWELLEIFGIRPGDAA